MFNYLDKLKPKDLKQYQYIMYADYLMNGLLTKFKYKGAPDSLDTRYLELYLRANGSAIIGHVQGEEGSPIACAPASLIGPIDDYNEGSRSFGVTVNGRIEGERGVDIVYARNNLLTRPDRFVAFYADILSEIQTSIRAITTYTRYIPIPLARNSKIKALLDDAINALRNGNLQAVTHDSIRRDFDGSLTELEMLNLSDVSASDKIQYLYKAVDDALRQFWLMNGQAVQGTGKMAQQSIKEVDGQTSLAYINTYNELIEREKMVDEINRIFGLDMIVELADPWQIELDKYTEELPIDAPTEMDIEEDAEDIAEVVPEEEEERKEEEEDDRETDDK